MPSLTGGYGMATCDTARILDHVFWVHALPPSSGSYQLGVPLRVLRRELQDNDAQKAKLGLSIFLFQS
jgi:hypothetical protein